MVAVKQLAQDGVQGRNEFLVEVLMLTVLNHPNLVSLVGFCVQGDERLLVYEYMPFGSLESHLFGNLFSSNFLFFLFGMFRGLSYFFWNRIRGLSVFADYRHQFKCLATFFSL